MIIHENFDVDIYSEPPLFELIAKFLINIPKINLFVPSKK